MNKLFIPCIYLDHGKAVKNFNDRSVVSADPIALAEYYSDHDADEIIVFDNEADAIANGRYTQRCKNCFD